LAVLVSEFLLTSFFICIIGKLTLDTGEVGSLSKLSSFCICSAGYIRATSISGASELGPGFAFQALGTICQGKDASSFVCSSSTPIIHQTSELFCQM
jgi:hypothetical protein